MLIIDINQSPENLAIDVFEQLKKIKGFSELSLLSPQAEKDNYLNSCRDFVACLLLESINGGLYEQSKDEFNLLLTKNALIAEFLLAVGHGFFDGEMSYLSDRLISSAVNNLYCAEKKLLASKVTYCTAKSPFIFSGKHLLDNLDKKEVVLLNALLSTAVLNNNDNHLICYKNSLKNAALKADVHFKQALILEHNIRQKLIESKPKPINDNQDAEFDFRFNAQFLSLLTQSILWSKKTEYIEIAKALYRSLSNRLFDQPGISTTEVIDISYALIDFCQIEYQQKTIDQVIARTTTLSELQHLKTMTKTKLIFLIETVKKLNINNKKLLSVNELPPPDVSIDVILLSGLQYKQTIEKNAALACYNPFLKIYSIK